MVEMIADRRFDEARRVGAGEAVLGLALELRVADEDRQHDFRARDDVVRLDILGLLLPRQLAEGADAPRQRRADALFMGAAVRRRNGVAIIRRSEEHTSELQSLLRTSYAVFFLKKQT